MKWIERATNVFCFITFQTLQIEFWREKLGNGGRKMGSLGVKIAAVSYVHLMIVLHADECQHHVDDTRSEQAKTW